jgi:plastocyanin
MPFTWKISITKVANPQPTKRAAFSPDPLVDVQIGDQIFWSNDDDEAHFPTPGIPTSPLVTPPLVSNQIAPNSTSSAFAPGQTGVFHYYCSRHIDETGSFVVSAAPPPPSGT